MEITSAVPLYSERQLGLSIQSVRRRVFFYNTVSKMEYCVGSSANDEKVQKMREQGTEIPNGSPSSESDATNEGLSLET